MVPRREGTYAIVAMVLVVAAMMLFAVPAWAQEQPVSEAQKDRIERLSDEEAREQFGLAAQEAAEDSSGDLVGNRVREEDNNNSNTFIDLVRILDAQNCIVEEDATIVFEDTANPGDLFTVVDNLNVQITSASGEIRVRDIRNRNEMDQAAPDPDIEFFNEQGQTKRLADTIQLDVANSSGIDCDGDDDGFDDELLLLILLELLEDNDNGDGGDGGNGDGGNGDGDYGDGDNGDDGDLDGDGDVDQEDELLEAENELNGEDTDGEDTLGDDFDDGEDGPVSATAEDGQAEASTPGAVASAGGDPDELEPLTSTPDDVVDEVPTSGPLPNTGGMPILYWLVPLAGLLMLAGLPVYRWAKRGE